MARVEIDDAALDLFLDETWERDCERRSINVANQARRLVTQHGSGRTYTTRFYRDRQGRLRRGGRRTPHTASAPGRPPATDTGRLLASIHHEIVGFGQSAEGRISAAVNYSDFLEFGTRYMAARPFLRPALYSAVDDFTGLTNSRGEEYF